MENDALFVQFVTAGTFVIMSYLPLILLPSAAIERLWTYFYDAGAKMRPVWFVSVILTAASFGYIQYFLQTTKHDHWWAMALQSTFLVSAAQWSGWATAGALRAPSNSDDPAYIAKRVAIGSVVATATASIGYFVYFVLYHNEATLVVAAAAIVMVHHVVLDAVIWSYGFNLR